MIKKKAKVLVIATSQKTRGGITSVINAHKKGKQWDDFSCKWIETHIDKGIVYKFIYLVRGFLQFLWNVPTFNLVHIHTSEPVSALRKLPFFIISKLLKKKTIIHFHSFSPETTINSKYKIIYNYLFSNSDKVLVLSEYWKELIEENIGLNSNIYVLYNPCARPEYSELVDKNKRILYAGTLNARKGYKDLIEAFGCIAQNHSDWKLVFAGNGEIHQAKALTKRLNIERQVSFLGWINGEEKAKAFQEASIFCLPSYAEGFPMAVLDALAYSLPVVCTPVGGVPDVLLNNVNSLLFQPGDIKDLAIKLDKLIIDNKLRDMLSQESSKLASTVFSVNNINYQLGTLYSEFS